MANELNPMNSKSDQDWKNSIVNQLNDRFENEMSAFNDKYSKAIDNSWLKSTSVMFMANETKIEELMNLDLNSYHNQQANLVNQVKNYFHSNNSVLGYDYDRNDFIRCNLELNRTGSTVENGSNSITKSGTLTLKFVNNEDKQDKKTAYKTKIVNLTEIICITCCANIINFPFPNVLFVYSNDFLFIFSFDNEKELDDWFATLNLACNCLNNLTESVFTLIYEPIVLLISLFGQAYAGYLFNDRTLQIKRNKLKQKLEQNQQAQHNLNSELLKLKETSGAQQKTNEQEEQEQIDNKTEQTIEQRLKDLKEEERDLNKLFEEVLIKSSQFLDNQIEKIYFMYLGSGNFKQLEFTNTGVIWGLTENGTPLVLQNNSIDSLIYNQSSNKLNLITDTQVYEIFENQRYYPFVGFQSKLLPTDRPEWSDESGLLELSKDQIKLPSSQWEWSQREWEFVCDSSTDEEGWQYSIDFQIEFHSSKKISDLVRRRKWSRLAKLETKSPWTKLSEDESSVCLKSISMYEANINNEENQKSDIILWSIDLEGNALVRKGVNKNNALGEKWLSVECREKLTSVTMSGQLIKENDTEEYFIQIWAVAVDGSCYLRHNVTFENPTGTLWFHIEPPNSGPITKLMSCPLNCFMLDKNHNFYFRDKIKLTYPEGLSWIKINSQVKILHASFPSNGNRFFAVVEVLDRTNRTIILVICQNYSNQYNLTENYDFKWKSFIRNAFKFVTTN